ncbi:unnamed protein product [Cladocopium goreaui]|uniref:Voltage-gated hydrogen channel 1 n=1 Tax=Cladocopium goreaui TaxID=2562237 RepID=A0A9P1CVI5_9DINO|nr:unnamed protein product [Cladocopium goreaui]|mmetsp:Transcript_26750/g.55508  ORF Transcript_26750/g.55508 Transcript_26750/m.55508 type:complete len:305 (-) Transcript_26750:141-1055(-)
MTETRNAEKHERVRDLKCRLHDLSGREQLMMVAAKQADVRLHEFPELGHFFPDLHIDVKSCRAALVRFLFSKCLHYGLIFLLLIDVILVMGGLQIKIEVVALQGMAIGSCYSTALEANSSSQEHHFHGLESGMECVREQSTYEFAEALEDVDFVFIILSIIILSIFLAENILFILAFRWNYFKIIFFPLDLFVVLLSLFTEFLSLFGPSLGDIENPLRTLGPNSSMSNGAISPLIAVLILGRFWRFIRIGHAVYLLQGSEEHEETLKEEYNSTTLQQYKSHIEPKRDLEGEAWVVTDVGEQPQP